MFLIDRNQNSVDRAHMVLDVDTFSIVMRQSGGARHLLSTVCVVRGVSREWRKKADLFWLSIVYGLYHPVLRQDTETIIDKGEAERLAAAIVQHSVVLLMRAKRDGHTTKPLRVLFRQIMQHIVGGHMMQCFSILESTFDGKIEIAGKRIMLPPGTSTDWCKRIAAKVTAIVNASGIENVALGHMAEPEKVLAAAALGMRFSTGFHDLRKINRVV